MLREGKKDKALEVINYSLKTIPDKSIPYDQISSNYVRFLFELGESKRALEIADTMATRADQVLTYAKSGHQFGSANSELYTLQTIIEACKEAKQTAAASKFEAIFQKHINAFG